MVENHFGRQDRLREKFSEKTILAQYNLYKSVYMQFKIIKQVRIFLVEFMIICLTFDLCCD